jgi:hypothetical protein
MARLTRTVEEIQESQRKVSSATFSPGDYVFASMYAGADPSDDWYVGTVERCDENAVYFMDTKEVAFKYAQLITKAEGYRILSKWKEQAPEDDD